MKRIILAVLVLIYFTPNVHATPLSTAWCTKRVTGASRVEYVGSVNFTGTTEYPDSGEFTQFSPASGAFASGASSGPLCAVAIPIQNTLHTSCTGNNVWVELWSSDAGVGNAARPVALLNTSIIRPMCDLPNSFPVEGFIPESSYFDFSTPTTIASSTKYFIAFKTTAATLASNAILLYSSNQTGFVLRETSGVFTTTSTGTAAKQLAMKVYTNQDPGLLIRTSFENCLNQVSTYADTMECEDDMVIEQNVNDPCSATKSGDINAVPASVSSKDGPWREVKTAYNYPGGTGMATRHYLGIIDYFGANANASVPMKYTFRYPGPSEFWMRFYLSFETLWKWGGLNAFKLLYPTNYLTGVDANGDHYSYNYVVDLPDAQCAPAGHCGYPEDNLNLGFGQIMQYGNNVNNTVGCSTAVWGYPPCGWKDFYHTGQSDATWHALEIHEAINSSGDAADGIVEYWLDGIKKFSATNVNFFTRSKLPGRGDVAGMDLLVIGDNGSLWYAYGTPGCHYIAFDDIEVRTDHYIGPLNKVGVEGYAPPLAAGMPVNIHVE